MVQPKDRRFLTEQVGEDSFLKKTDANTQYLKKTDGENTYLKQSDLNFANRAKAELETPGSLARRALGDAFVERDEFSGLLRWQAAYAARYEAQARVAVISDYEGIGSATPHHRTRWHRMLELALRGPQVGGAGFIPAMYADTAMTDPGTRTGDVSDVISNKGAGGRYINIKNSGVFAFPSETMTSFRLWYHKGDFFSSTGQVKVDDGATIVSIDSSNAGEGIVDAVTWPALPAAPHPLTRGDHVVSVTGPASSSASQISAIQMFDGDENSGVHVFDLGRKALTWADIVAEDWIPWLWQAWLEKVDPHLIIIMLGSHNYGNPVDFTTTHMETAVSRLDAMTNKSKSSVLFVSPPRPIKNPPGSPTVWAAYVSKLREIAAFQPERFSFLDMQEYWPELVGGGGTSLGLMHETDYPTNPSAAGQRRFVDVLTKVLI